PMAATVPVTAAYPISRGCHVSPPRGSPRSYQTNIIVRPTEPPLRLPERNQEECCHLSRSQNTSSWHSCRSPFRAYLKMPKQYSQIYYGFGGLLKMLSSVPQYR